MEVVAAEMEHFHFPEQPEHLLKQVQLISQDTGLQEQTMLAAEPPKLEEPMGHICREMEDIILSLLAMVVPLDILAAVEL
jgi:hypothetical protein